MACGSARHRGVRSGLGVEPRADQEISLGRDDDRAFQAVCAELPEDIEPVRLYSSYLTSFTINTGKE